MPNVQLQPASLTEQETVDLTALRDTLQDLPHDHPIPWEQIQRLAQGMKIEAIKLVRERPVVMPAGLGLKEAKTVVEAGSWETIATALSGDAARLLGYEKDRTTRLMQQLENVNKLNAELQQELDKANLDINSLHDQLATQRRSTTILGNTARDLLDQIVPDSRHDRYGY